MDEVKRALSEVHIIIKAMPLELTSKIPDTFKETVESERDKTYQLDIDELLIKNNMMEETISILAMIYRDFLSDKEEIKE